MSARWMVGMAVACALCAACGGGSGGGSGGGAGGGPSVQPTTGLTYAVLDAVYTKGVAITANAPAVEGGAPAAFSVAPALPQGLTLDAATGVIAGTPGAVAPEASYRVTAGNSAGSASATLRIAVHDAPPAGLSYAASVAVYTRTVAVVPNVPSSAGGAVVSYEVAPPLPAGLRLEPTTGVVSGTPEERSPEAAYVVTARNTGGAATATLTLTVNAVPPRALTYAAEDAVYTRGQAVAPNLPSAGGDPVTTYAVTPELPPGLALDPEHGALTGTPTAVTPAGAYLVTASNSGGSASAVLTLTVNDVPPAELVYEHPRPVYTLGAQVAPNRASATGGEILSFDVDPALPSGLRLDAWTGTLAGTPAALAAEAAYVVTARNTGGSTTATLHLTVNDRPPSALAYAAADARYDLLSPIAPNTPSASGGAVVRYTVAPALPAGLELDPDTGIIGGTPTALSPRSSYQVTATNTGGSTTATLSIAVVEEAPSALGYPDDPALYMVGVAVPPNAPAHAGGGVARYEIAPALPPGLSLDPVSGVLSGTPGSAAPLREYTVTASNSGGEARCTLRIEVVASAAAPVVTLAPYVTAGKAGVRAVTQAQPLGTRTSWSVSRGTITAGQGTATLLFTPGDPGPLAVTVRVQRGDETLEASASATIVPPPSARIFAQDRVFRSTEGIVASVPPQQDVTCGWTLSLPGGAVTAGEVGPVLRYRSGDVLGTYRLTARVENLAGDADEDTRELRVVSREFLADASGPQLTGAESATVLADGRLLAVGPKGAELFDPSTSTWALVASPATPRSDHTATLLPSGKVLIAGGTSGSSQRLRTAELYDPATRTWSPAASMSRVRYLHVAASLDDGRVLVAGGGDGSGYVPASEIYDPAVDAWTPAAPLAAARLAHRATVLAGGRVLISGGYDGSASLRSAELYDPVADRWTPAGTMDIPRHYHVAVRLASGRVLVAGGMAFDARDATASVYDPATNAWSPVAPMATPRGQAAAALLPDGRALVTGGRQGGVTFSSAELFDERTDTWAPAPDLAQARMDQLETVLPDGSILVLGGHVWNGDAVGVAERYDPSSNTWTATGAPALPSTATATLLADGRLLVAGGLVMGAYQGIPQTRAMLYDPVARTWTPTGSMGTPRWAHTATLLADGRVLVVGGRDVVEFAPPSIDGAELYDPVTGTWAQAASLSAARTLHTAVRLQDGRVLVAGGSLTGGWDALAGAEVYEPAADRWTAVGDMTAARHSHTATLLPSGLVLVSGGSGSSGSVGGTAELFDPGTDQWRATGSLSSSRSQHAAALLSEGTVLVSGGALSTETYDPAAERWTPAGSLSIARRSHPMVALPSGGAMVVCGYPYDGSQVSENYDPASRTWTAGAALPTVRDGTTMTALPDGTVMVMGGFPAGPPMFWRE